MRGFAVNPSKITNFFHIFKGRPLVNTAIALLQVGVILFAGYQLYKSIEKATVEEFKHHQLLEAGKASGGIQLHFEFLAGAMKTLAKMQKIHQLNEKAARQLLALEINELKRFGVVDIGVLDANGVLKNMVGMHRSVGKDFSRQKYYQRAREHAAEDMMITEFIKFTDSPAGQNGILIAAPMLTTGSVEKHTNVAKQFAGVVFCTVRLETIIKKFVSSIRSSKKGHTFLIDDQYTVLWSPDQTLVGKNFWQAANRFPSFQEVLQKMAAGDSGTPEFFFYRFDESTNRYSEKSGEHYIAYVPVQIGQMRWSLAVWAPREEAKSLIQPGYFNQLLLIGLVIMIILIGPAYSLIAAFRYSRSLEKKVEKKTEEIRTAHQRLLTVLNSLDAAVYVVDMNSYEILFINKYLRDVCGDVTGKICWQVLQNGKSAPCNFCVNEKLLNKDNQPAGVHVWEQQNSITKKWFQMRDRAIPWVDGRIVKLEIASDISDRKAAEEKLKQTSEQLSSVLESLPIVPYTCGTKGDFGITFISNAVEDMTGYTPDQFLADSKFWLSHIHPNDKKRVLSELPEIFKHKSLVCDYSFRTADGSYKLISDTRTLIKEPDDEMSHITGIWQDITEKKRLQKDTLIRMYPRKRDGFGYIVGLSSPMQEVYERVSKIIAMDVKTVLILGETGTGKDLISRTIHDLSSRRTHPYTEINCANIPENLLESELFGYEKGAFTDAKGLKRGLFEQALTGTILLNEIGHMRLDLQAKLLKVIEHRTFRRVGGTKDLDIDVRILAATNKSLWEAVENGEFREDLYYRIKLVPIYMPPLRKRKEDIPLLIGHLLRQANREFKKDVRGVTKDAEAMMLAYDWPGNVRELKNVIERAVILGDKNQIRIDNLPKEIVVNKKDDPAELELSGKDLSLTGIEKKMIEEALKKTDGNQVQAARLLKLSRHAMRYRMKKYGFL